MCAANGSVHKFLETRYGFNLVRALVYSWTHGKHQKVSTTNRPCMIFATFLALKNSIFTYGYFVFPCSPLSFLVPYIALLPRFSFKSSTQPLRFSEFKAPEVLKCLLHTDLETKNQQRVGGGDGGAGEVSKDGQKV